MTLTQNKTAETEKLTPMMAQYLSVKQRYQDILLFYRMGDFYEMFLHDAKIASEALGIALTHRGQIKGEKVAMCGVPVHAMDNYLVKLIKMGHRVAICEQSETPESFKNRGGKGPLPRDVVRVITPGTLQEEGLLNAHQNNFLAAIGRVSGEFSVAWADMSTGSFQVQACQKTDLEAVLERIKAAEFVYPDELEELVSTFACSDKGMVQPAAFFDHRKSNDLLLSFYQLATLGGLGSFSPEMLSAAGGLLAYLQKTQLKQMPYLQPLAAIWSQVFVTIDGATRKSLELTQTLSSERKGSLLQAIDRTRTAGGARLLHRRLSEPLTDKKRIENRLGLVSWFLQNSVLCAEISDYLSKIPDLERALTRLMAGRGGPRDLASLAKGIADASDLTLALLHSGQAENNPDIAELAQKAGAPAFLAEKILPALADELPILVRDGQFIRQGYDTQLDEIRVMRDDSRRLIAGLQTRYSQQTDISNLKIKHNNVLGYHIDIRALHGEKLMNNPEFIHRQTTAQTIRFTTIELADMEKKLSSAADKALILELELFERLAEQVIACKDDIFAAAQALAKLDVANATARLAEQENYCCPVLSDDRRFFIKDGRHPVVEQSLPSAQSFMANDCQLDENQNLWLLTGPNMAGKSTYLRQNAHIAIMAQAGFYVPARSAEIGIIDKIFSRVGASDDLARGQSTFMVEMVETAAILNQSTDRSLVILDEIGRGTATWDGLAIAWACLEYLHDQINCRALFATHYHELTVLQTELLGLRCYAMQVKEWKGDIVFLHQVAAGSADKSYGVHVARLAGLPKKVTKRAAQLVTLLEAKSATASAKQNALPLFDFPPADDRADQVDEAGGDEIEQMIEALEPDRMTPKEALDYLYELKTAHQDKDR